MPGFNKTIGGTIPRTGTFQYRKSRLTGLTLVIPAAAGVTEVTNRRIVSIQQDTNNQLFAVVSMYAFGGATIGGVVYSAMTLVGFGVLEESLQSGVAGSIAPVLNTFSSGDTVTVLTGTERVYQIDYDPDNIPDSGIGVAYVDAEGRLTSASASPGYLITGATFFGVDGIQMTSQLGADCIYYQPSTPLHP